MTPFPLMDKSAVAQCPKCAQEWAVFSSSEALPLELPAEKVEIVETERSIEPYSESTRTLDNRRATSEATQTITLSESWTQSIQFDRERARTTSAGGGLKLEIVSLEAKVETSLRDTYSIGETRQRTSTEEIEVSVPARTLRRLHLRFNRVWQHGLARVPLPAGGVVELPFRVALHLSLDWQQEDEPA